MINPAKVILWFIVIGNIIAPLAYLMKDQASIELRRLSLGPYTRTEDPLIFWPIILTHLAIAYGFFVCVRNLGSDKNRRAD